MQFDDLATQHAGISSVRARVKVAIGLMLVATECLAQAPATQPVDPQLAAAIQTLHQQAQASSAGLRISNADPRVKAIELLRTDGSPAAVKGLLEFLQMPYASRAFKQQALMALAQIGSQEAIDAITRFEKWAASRHREPPFQFGDQDFAANHFAPMELAPSVSITAADGSKWALFQSNYEAWKAMTWLTHSKDGKQWTSPQFLGAVEPAQNLLEDLAAGRKTVSQVAPDADQDGLADALEKILGTDVNNADSDSDGVADREDGNPLTPARKELDDTALIRQAVFSMAFATGSSRDVILVPARAGIDHELNGFAGWVVPTAENRQMWVNLTGIDVRMTSETTAEASISDWEAAMGGASYRAQIVLKHGKWVVTDYRLFRIS